MLLFRLRSMKLKTYYDDLHDILLLLTVNPVFLYLHFLHELMARSHG